MKYNHLLPLVVAMGMNSVCAAQSQHELAHIQHETEQLTQAVKSLKEDLKIQAQRVGELTALLVEQSKTIDSLNARIAANSNGLSDIETSTNERFDHANAALENKSTELSASINRKAVYAGVCGLLALMAAVILFFLNRWRTKRRLACLDSFQAKLEMLDSTRKDIDNNILSTNSKVIDLIEKQLTLPGNQPDNAMENVDHSLAVAVANELTRIQQNLNHMDATVKGVSQLKNRAKAILTTLNSKQYDVPELLGHEYHEGDNMVATMELNEDLEAGTNRIKRVIKPQVSYKGKLVQAAEVVVEFR